VLTDAVASRFSRSGEAAFIGLAANPMKLLLLPTSGKAFGIASAASFVIL